MKTTSLLILTALLVGSTAAQVEVGENLTIDQENAEINTTGEWNVSNIVAREQETEFGGALFSIESANPVYLNLDFFYGSVRTGNYLANFSANTTTGADVNYTINQLDSDDAYRTFKNNSELKTAFPVNQLYFFEDTMNGIYQNYSILNFLDTRGPRITNLQNSDEDNTYSVNNPQKMTLSADLQDTGTGLAEAYLTTNETRSFRNYTIEYGGTKQFNGEDRASVEFTWDNVQLINQDRDVSWAIWARDQQGNWRRSDLQQFKIRERPVITRVTTEDVRQGDISQIKARVVDPTGFADIVNVTFRVTRPGGQTHNIRAVRGEQISVDQYTGNVFTYNYTNTVDAGAYTVETIAYDETGKDSQDNFFDVGPITELLKRLLLNPFYIGQSNIIQALFIIFEQQKYLIGGLLLAVLATLTSIKYTNEGITKDLFDRIQKVRQEIKNEE